MYTKTRKYKIRNEDIRGYLRITFRSDKIGGRRLAWRYLDMKIGVKRRWKNRLLID